MMVVWSAEPGLRQEPRHCEPLKLNKRPTMKLVLGLVGLNETLKLETAHFPRGAKLLRRIRLSWQSFARIRRAVHDEES